MAVRNHGGGTVNHNLFWRIMAPKAGGEPEGQLAKSLEAEFGSFVDFKSPIRESRHGKVRLGWAWLGEKKVEN